MSAQAGQSLAHESAAAQVAGAVTYIDDIAEVRGTLHAAPILSTQAHARLLGVDASAALAMIDERNKRIEDLVAAIGRVEEGEEL